MSEATTTWLLSTAGMIFGSILIGFVIGCRFMAVKAKQMIEGEVIEENDSILDAEELTARQ